MKKLIFLLPFLVLACAEEKDLSSSKAIFLTAEIVTPASWDDVKGIVPINVLVSPENQTDSVRILINGNSAVTLKTSPFTFDWDTNGLSGGQTILAEATSSEGQIFLSQKTTVYVKNETFLSVNLVSPANFSTVTGNVLIKVSAFDSFGISKVEFFQNGNLLGEDTTEPYEFVWDTSGISGDFALNAKAYNLLGDFRETYPISVKINPSDVVPPTVYVSSPANFSEVSGTVKITAVASDNKGIASVSFYVDSDSVGTDFTEPYEFLWDTNGLSGSHSITAKATDTSGNIAFAYPASVTVNTQDVVPPTVYVSSPASFSEVSGTVKITAVASDNKGIASVSFYVDSDSVGTDFTEPYEFLWDTNGLSGSHSITAKATDTSGNIAFAYPASVSIRPPPQIQITSPAQFQVVSGTIQVRSTISEVNAVDSLQVFLNGIKASTLQNNYTSFPLNTTIFQNNSNHTIFLKVFANGLFNDSQVVTFVVQNP